MYGIINKAIEDLVKEKFGNDYVNQNDHRESDLYNRGYSK
ncbi:MAG: hypothetical protein ACI9RM_001099 [Ulvibacter sp.]|jgi:hypothetical protein